MTYVRRASAPRIDLNSYRQQTTMIDQASIEQKLNTIKELTTSINSYQKLNINELTSKQKGNMTMYKGKLTAFEKIEQKNNEYKQLLLMKQNININREKSLLSYNYIQTEPSINHNLPKTFLDSKKNTSSQKNKVFNLKCYFNNMNLQKNKQYYEKCPVIKNKNIKTKIKVFTIGYTANPFLKLKTGIK